MISCGSILLTCEKALQVLRTKGDRSTTVYVEHLWSDMARPWRDRELNEEAMPDPRRARTLGHKDLRLSLVRETFPDENLHSNISSSDLQIGAGTAQTEGRSHG